jgi:tetratricopeptide (TPR) repeat protein
MADLLEARDDVSGARVWRVRAAGVAAKHGDVKPLEALVESGLADDPAAWIEVGNCYFASDDYDAAGAAADRALVLDPSSGAALVSLCRLAMILGDADMLHRVSMALLASKPAWHEGPEFLARSFARRLDIDAALMHSARSLEMASYCHNAWTARAEALTGSLKVPPAGTPTDGTTTRSRGAQRRR